LGDSQVDWPPAVNLKRIWFRLRGLDPEAVVVSFATGEEELVQAMVQEVRRLLPDRRHFLVRMAPGPSIDGVQTILHAHRGALRRLRTGMAPVLFTSDKRYSRLRLAAFLHAPTKILAYNARLERHHLQPSCPLASLLFWLGVPLDRIWLRPKGWPGRREHTIVPDQVSLLEGRPQSPARARLAVLSPYVPYPLSHGGAVRMYHLLREASLTHDIHLFAFTETGEPAPEALLAFCARITLVPKPRYREPRWASLDPPEVCEYRSPAMRRAIDPSMLLQTEYTQLASYGGDILVEHDITFDLYRQVHDREQTLSSWWNWWRWRRFERRALKAAKVAVVMSAKDAALSRHPRPVVIANGVDLDRFTPSPEKPGRRILFIGSFRHFPNVSAFRFFLEQVWPRLDAEWTVVAGPDPLTHSGLRALPVARGLRILEFVADVKPLYEDTNLVVVPTLVSAGTNIKVLEAMAMERAVVSTPSGCAGLGLRHGESVWIADTAQAFADGVSKLLSDDALRASIARRARLIAERDFAWRTLGAQQRRLLSQLAPPPLRIRPATEHDLLSIAQIQQASPQAAQWDPQSYLSHRCLVAELGPSVIGFLVLRLTSPAQSEMLNLAVSPGYRRQGVASQLVAAALEHAQGDMFLEVRQSNIAARKLYSSLGFREQGVRPGYYENPPEPAIVMNLRSC
jgi:ribosomal-protein-alanine acetyltransferase